MVDFAIPAPGQTPTEAVDERIALAADSRCNVALHGCVVDWDAGTAEELRALSARGINTVKLFTTYRGKFMAGPSTVKNVLEVLRSTGGLAYIHAECNDTIERVMSEDEERANIERAVASFEQTSGRRPDGWYCRYTASTNTRRLLVENGGYTYDSDAYNDDLPYFVDVAATEHLIAPYTLTYNDAKMIAPFGSENPKVFAEHVISAVEELRHEGLAGHPKMLSVGLHPRLAGQAGRARALRMIIEHCLEAPDVWIARRIDIARAWIDRFGASTVPASTPESDTDQATGRKLRGEIHED